MRRSVIAGTALVAVVLAAVALWVPGRTTAAPPPVPSVCTEHAPADRIAILDGYTRLSPAVRTQNLSDAVRINNSAPPAEARRAVDDNYAINRPAIFDALGSRLGAAFSAALRAGDLPKTTALLLGGESVVARCTDTSAEKEYFAARRPFEVEPQAIRRYSDIRKNPYDPVRGSGSFPSGHAVWGYAQAFLIAAMLPELGPQLLARGAEYGSHRVVLGVHSPLDVIGGRMRAQATVARMLGDRRFTDVFAQARTELRDSLSARSGAPLARIAASQRPWIPTADALTTYRQRATFAFAPTGGATDRPAAIPPAAVNLIRPAHPGLSDAQLRALLARTALPAGNPLDIGGPFGGWQRLDLARAWVAP